MCRMILIEFYFVVTVLLLLVNYMTVCCFAVSICFYGNSCLILIPDTKAENSTELSTRQPNAERYKTLKQA
jgi:hypothetical protein